MAYSSTIMHGAGGSWIAPPIRTIAAAPQRRLSNLLPLLLFAALLSVLPTQPMPVAAAASRGLHQQTLAIRAENASTSPLHVTELDPPVLTPRAPDCQAILMVHVFGESYGKPYVGAYAPPACEFNRVVLNLTVTSRGRQYDRLALMYFNDTEIFRTSTAEPTADGIIWTYMKDMSAYVSLFKEPQKIIFELGNLISDVYTGSFNTTLTASFYNDADAATFEPADAILPVSAGGSSSDSGSAFTLPADNTTTSLTIPANVERAIFSIAACGQAEEEFWMSSVPNSLVDTFGAVTELYGFWPFRELQLFIDGNLAGVAWPFPIIFTGGVVASFWRPLVGIDAFDLKEDQIDVTPWLGLLSDGAAHSFEIRVTGLNETGPNTAVLSETVNNNWVVTGKLFLWYSASNSSTNNGATTGTHPTVSAPSPSINTWYEYGGGISANGTNNTLSYAVNVTRSLSVSATVNGAPRTWSQELYFTNYNNFTDSGNNQYTTQNTTARDVSSSGADADSTLYTRFSSYPLTTFVRYVSSDALTYLGGWIDRGKRVTQIGASAFPLGLAGFDSSTNSSINSPNSPSGTHLSTRQNGTGSLTIQSLPAAASSRASAMQQRLDFGAVAPDGGVELLYEADALAVNGSWVKRESDGDVGDVSEGVEEERNAEFAPKPLKEMLGHGPRATLLKGKSAHVGVGARVGASVAPVPSRPLLASAAARRRARLKGAGEL